MANILIKRIFQLLLFINLVCVISTLMKDTIYGEVKSISRRNLDWTPQISRKRRIAGIPSKIESQLPLDNKMNHKIASLLEGSHNAFENDKGGFVELNCDNDASRLILGKYPRASRLWTHNNFALKIQNDRMVYQMGTLTIQNVQGKDQGVYLCRIEYEPKQIKTIALFSLIVHDEEFVTNVRATETLKLQCNSAPIGYLFPTATRSWWKQSSKERTNISAALTNDDSFPNAKENFAGTWICIVEHNKTKTTRLWKTALFQVVVDPPPSQAELFLIYIKENPIEIGMVVLAVLGFLAVLCISCMYKVDQNKQRVELELESFKSSLLAGNEDFENNSVSETFLSEINDKGGFVEINEKKLHDEFQSDIYE